MPSVAKGIPIGTDAVVLGSTSDFRALTGEEDTGRLFAGRTGGQPPQNRVIAISPSGSEASLSLKGGLPECTC